MFDGFPGLAVLLPPAPLNTECELCGEEVGEGDPITITTDDVHEHGFVTRKRICGKCFSEMYEEWAQMKDKRKMSPILSSYFFSGSLGGQPVQTFSVKRFWFETAPKKKLVMCMS